MEDLLFERLERMNASVEPEIILQDLYFVDRIVRPLAGPDGDDYRVPFLLEALESRGFCASTEGCWEAIELYDDLCDLFDIDSYGALARFLGRFGEYHRAHHAGVVERGE